MAREVSVAQLAAELRDGETVFIGGCAGEPRELTQLLFGRPQVAPAVRFVASFIPGINGRNLADMGSNRHMQVFFMQPGFRAARAEGRIRFSPISYFGVQQHLAHPDTRIDAAIVQLSEPDARGICSLGPSVEFMPALIERGVRLLGIVNPRVPRIAGAMELALDRCSAYARSTAPLPEYDAGASNPVTDRIVAQLAVLIPNGAAIQVGIGKVPAQLLPALHAHRELVFHSGMLSDAILPLHEAGCLDRRHPLTAAVLVGTERLYASLDKVPDLRVTGVGYTHNPEVLAKLPPLYAINSALEVDLLGQVNAEMLSGRYLSGPGGLPDFAAAAHRHSQGLSIIALPSTDPKGKISRIVAQFAPGTPVTVPQHDVDAVVTEHGVARLRGVDLDERIRRMIAVAHPDHRAALEAEARRET